MDTADIAADPTPVTDGGTLAFRDATEADVPVLMDVIQRAYRLGAGRSWTSETDLVGGGRTTVPVLLGLMADPGARLLVAERDGTVIGCGNLENQGDSAHFGMFAVDPDVQAGGVGRRILAEAERIAREEWGIREMRMVVVSVREELIAWYVRRGYRRTGQLSPFPYDDSSVGRPKRTDLAFELLLKDLDEPAAG
ncbi:GNAT family N-acetyltransferase [Streptomyces yaizuensis]|uniref:GNAT family N-acetyltransferase n=1 Tax=Streptomyces yaizuensis TaxID=2989713 RepID=A0ABQ5NYB8_9ACTN|nr:GNAT family N-acetyltransferase [Streptomyces sp. YSPA8]GLF95343.1 GNAT family N-acetyltransferase [Streptomyces sp. YSPA8]